MTAPSAPGGRWEGERELRAALAADGGEPLGSGYQATVRLYRGTFGAVVVKEPRPWPLLAGVTAWSLRREHEVYRRLRSVPGVPRCHALLDDRCLVLEHIEGRSLRRAEREGAVTPQFYDRLLATLREMHAAGVAHGDLKRKDNVLVAADGTPYVIDFGIAVLAPPDGGGGVLFKTWRQMDYNAWLKLKYQRRVADATPEDAALYRPLWIERAARSVRIPWQAITLRRIRNRTRAR